VPESTVHTNPPKIKANKTQQIAKIKKKADLGALQ
jgi:hypothetical protein